MNQNLQSQFMYLFERVGEPLYFGPRGANNMYYNVPIDSLPTRLQHAANEFRKSMGAGATAFTVSAPKQMPNLSNIGRSCPRSSIFSYFVPVHRQAAEELKKILMEQSNLDDFLAMSCSCRDNDMINPRLFIYAFAASCLRRTDMKGFKIPAFWEIAPDQFVSPDVIRLAQKQAIIPAQDRSIIMVDRNFTGNDSNPENLVAYFREDLGVNSHHWHWHLIYPTTSPKGERDRKGELFYWMHHDMLARYEAERLCNGLARTKRLDLSESIPEGYFPKLYNTNAGRIWGARQENTKLSSVERMADTRAPFQAEMENMKKWRDRILEAIDTGVVIGARNERIQLTVEKGIDILGDLVEASDLTPNKQFYGDFHNDGHILIACSHDPKFSHKENIGVMGDSSTAMRDPAFYRWHKYIDSIFDKYKGTIKPYTLDELAWQGIKVSEISVQTPNRSERNTLHTNWMQSDIDLSRGIDFGRTNMNNLGSVWARVTHLNHENFAYRIVVNNSGPQRQGTVRILMAPRLNEQKSRFTYQEQRLLFFEMDKFLTTLLPGDNVINRKSEDSAVTIPWEQSFRELERQVDTPTASQAVCGCGWPQHMLLPKGNSTGVVFDLYVIVTDATKDQVARKNRRTEGQRQGCKESITYCGLLDELYPDARAMGFPFDRHGRREGNAIVKDLDHFMRGVPNSKATQVRIIHSDRTIVREGGAPSGVPILPAESAPSSTNSSPSTSRPSSPSAMSRPNGGRGTIDFGRPQPPKSDRQRQPSTGNGGGPWWTQPTQPSFGNTGNGSWNWPSRPASGGRGAGGSRSPSPQGWTTINHASAGSSWGG